MGWSSGNRTQRPLAEVSGILGGVRAGAKLNLQECRCKEICRIRVEEWGHPSSFQTPQRAPRLRGPEQSFKGLAAPEEVTGLRKQQWRGRKG